MEEKIGTLVLVRHGQSQWNLENRFTGSVDVPLSENGEAEARKAGELLKGTRFDHAFTSALARAQETLRIILDVIDDPDVPTERDPALDARHYGDLEGLNKAETAAKFGEEQVQLWRRGFDVNPPNGESLKETRDRVLPYYREKIEPLLKAGKRVLVVAHGNSLRALVMVLDTISETAVAELNIPTGAPMRYLIDAEGNITDRGYIETLNTPE